jgi:transcriptional regulator with XRE-family HTH domain
VKPPVRTPERTPPARTRRASAAPAAKHAGASLATSLARQLQSFATSVLGGVGTATDVAFTLAQSRIHRPGTKAAVAKGAALLRDLRQAAGLTLDDLGRALEVDDPSFMGLVEAGKVGLPLELILRLTAVLGRNDPVGFALQMTRAYNPTMWKALEALGVGQLLVQAGREREFANIYRSHDAARALSDADFAAALSFADAAFASALAFQAQHKSGPSKVRGTAVNRQ